MATIKQLAQLTALDLVDEKGDRKLSLRRPVVAHATNEISENDVVTQVTIDVLITGVTHGGWWITSDGRRRLPYSISIARIAMSYDLEVFGLVTRPQELEQVAA